MDACSYVNALHLNADLVSEIRAFCLKIEGFSGRKDFILAIRGVDMLSDASLIILMCLRDVRKHSSSNGCMSLRHRVILPRLIWCLKSGHFA